MTFELSGSKNPTWISFPRMSIFVCGAKQQENCLRCSHQHKNKEHKGKAFILMCRLKQKRNSSKGHHQRDAHGNAEFRDVGHGETTQREHTKTSHQEPAGSKSTLIRTIHKELQDSGKSCARRSTRPQSFSDTKSVTDTSQFRPLIG